MRSAAGAAVRPAQPLALAVAVTGSKGGVGKSNLVVNVAVALARWGRRVLVVDGDLGLANLDVLLGLVPSRNVEHVLSGEASLEDALVEGPCGIRILPAASGIPELSNVDPEPCRRLLALLEETCRLGDVVLVDTGAGLGGTTLTLQLAASRVVLVTTPEPTSLVDAYATLKVLWAADPHKRVDLVVNAAESDEEAARAFEQVAKAARHFLHREPGWLGAVHRDTRVPEAVRRQRALVELYPDSPAGRCYEQLALRLALSPDREHSPVDYWQRLAPAGDQEWSH